MSKKIKVTILHNIMTPYRYPLFKKISLDPNVNLTVLFMSKSAKNRRWKIVENNLGFKYRVLPKIEFNFQGKDLFTYLINYTYPFDFIKNMPDVVISAGWLDFSSQAAFFLCKVFRKKFIIWSESTENEKSWRRSVTLPLVRTIVKYSDACIAVGTRSKEYLKLLGASESKIFVAYSTVNTSFFNQIGHVTKGEKEKLRKRIGLKTNNVILYVGQFIKRKGVDYLVDAYQEVKKKFNDVSLLLVGYGSLKEDLEKRIDNQNINDVFFINHVEPKDMAKIYSLATLFILPSLEETWGLVINEAMAVGLPIVTTDKVGSSVDLVKPGYNGFIVPSADSKALKDSIYKIIKDDTLIKKMSGESKKIIKNFSPELAARQFVNAINFVSN